MDREAVLSQHGCALVLGNCGVMIVGPSGSGKSRLTHQLIDRWSRRQTYARWVADDRVILQQSGDRIQVQSPKPIQGLAERRFSGVEEVDWQSRAIVDLVVELVPQKSLERLPEKRFIELVPTSPQLPFLQVPEASPNPAMELIEAKLDEISRIPAPESH